MFFIRLGPIISLLVQSCCGVDITIKWISPDPDDWGLDEDHSVEARCIDLLPGTCCRPTREMLPSLNGIGSSVVTISRLLVDQLGFGYNASGRRYDDITDCTGRWISGLVYPPHIPKWFAAYILRACKTDQLLRRFVYE